MAEVPETTTPTPTEKVTLDPQTTPSVRVKLPAFGQPRVTNDEPIEVDDPATINANREAEAFAQEHAERSLVEKGKEVADEGTIKDTLAKLPGLVADYGARAGRDVVEAFGRGEPLFGAVRGVTGGIVEMANTANDIMDYLTPKSKPEGPIPTLPGPIEIRNWVGEQLGTDFQIDTEKVKEAVGGEAPKTGTGTAIEGITQFLTGFIPAYKAAKGLNALQYAGRFGQEALTEITAGAFAGAFTMSPKQANITAQLLDHFPSMKNPVTEWLATKEDDPNITNRAKNAVEEAIAGPVGVTVWNGFRLLKGMMRSGGHTELAAVERMAQIREQHTVKNLKLSLGDDAPEAPLVSLREPDITNVNVDPNEFVFTGKKHNFTPDDLINVMHDYKLMGYKTMNQILRDVEDARHTNPDLDPADIISKHGVDPKQYERDVAGLDLLTKRDPSQDELLMRSQKMNRDKWNGIQIGQERYTEQFLSTTRSLDTAGHFFDRSIERISNGEEVPVFFEIQSTKGGKVLDIHKQMGAGDDEKEVLFGRGSVFEIVGKEEKELPWTHGKVRVLKLKYRPDRAPKRGFSLNSLGEVPESALNINLTKIDTPDDIKMALVRTEELLRDEFKGIREAHLDESAIRRLSDATGVPVSKLVEKHGELLPERAIAIRTLLASSASNLLKRAKVASQTGSATDLVAFRKSFAVHSAIQAEAIGQAARAGRLLRSFRTPVSDNKALARQLDELIMKDGGTAFSEKAAAAVADLDVEQLMRNGGTPDLRSRGGKMWDGLMEWWINSLLSAPATHAVNLMSNAATALWSIPENALATAVEEGASAAAHGTGARMYGMVYGIKEGLSLMHHAFSKEGLPPGVASKIDIGRVPEAITMEGDNWLARAVRGFGKAVRLPGQALISEDILFKSIGYRMKLYQEAALTAHQEGLRGSNWAKRVNEIVSDPPEELRMSAIGEADYLTFTQKPGDVARGITQLRNAHPVLKIFAPFVNTPANILKYTFERTPLAPLMKSYREQIAQGGRVAATARTRMAMGTGIMMVFANEAAQGNVTGSPPADPALAKIWLKDHQPYSIKIGNKWVQYSRLDPVGFLVGFAADFSQIAGYLDEGQAGEAIAAASLAALGNFTDKTYLAGLSFLNSLLGLGEGSVNVDLAAINRNFLQLGSSFLVPRGVAQIARATNEQRLSVRDETQSYVETFMNQLKAEIPGWGEGMPVEHNIAGEPVLPSHGVGPENMSIVYNSVSPFRTKDMKMDPISQVLLDNHIGIDFPARSIQGTSLTEHEYQFLKATRGRLLWQSLGKIIDDVDFKNAPPHIKEIAVRRAVLKAGKAAQGILYQQYPNLINRVAQKKAYGIDTQPDETEKR